MNRETDELFKKADERNLPEVCLRVAQEEKLVHQPWCPDRAFLDRAEKCPCNTNVPGTIRISGI